MKSVKCIHVTKLEFDAILDGRKRFGTNSSVVFPHDTIRFETGDTPTERAVVGVTVDFVESTEHCFIFSFTPNSHPRYLLSDSEGPERVFRTLEDALEQAKKCIDKCRPEGYGDSWHDETEDVTVSTIYPRIIYRATMINIEPVMGEDDDGYEVETEDFTCDYEMKKV